MTAGIKAEGRRTSSRDREGPNRISAGDASRGEGKEEGEDDGDGYSSREVRPSRSAYLVSSATLWSSSLSMMFWRWVSTVFTLR